MASTSVINDAAVDALCFTLIPLYSPSQNVLPAPKPGDPVPNAIYVPMSKLTPVAGDSNFAQGSGIIQVRGNYITVTVRSGQLPTTAPPITVNGTNVTVICSRRGGLETVYRCSHRPDSRISLRRKRHRQPVWRAPADLLQWREPGADDDAHRGQYAARAVISTHSPASSPPKTSGARFRSSRPRSIPTRAWWYPPRSR